MALSLIRAKAVAHGNSHLRFFASVSTMKKGLVLGLYETDDENKVVLTSTAAKYNELVKGQLWKYILLAGPKIPKGQARVFWGLDETDYNGVAVVGLGKQGLGVNKLEEVHEGKENVRVAAAAGCRALDDVDIKDIKLETLGDAEAAAEGAGLCSWLYQGYKNEEKRKKLPKISLYGEEGEMEWRMGIIKAQAQNWARELADTPANLMTPTIFSQQVSEVLTHLGVDVQIHDKSWAEQKKMGSFLSVARGSCESPKFLEIKYKGAENPNEAPVTFVGKGVTFDAGGISLKPPSDMNEMRADMGGAACVAATIRAAAELKLKKNIVGLIPLTENLPSGHATKPGDLVKAMNGKTIIVDNTDAEGRLILADALCYAQEFNPRFILDIATLTGAIRVSLSTAATGVFTNDGDLYETLRNAGTITGDRVWRLPLWQHFTDEITKKVKGADLNNIAKSKGGGSCTAAAFLKEFVGNNIPWMHLDIAGVMGPAHDELPYVPAGMTGRPTLQRAKDLLTKGKHKTNDCFVTIALGKEKYQTSVKEKAAKDVEWHEECELLIPEQGNTAEIVLTALHRNFLGVDEFLGTISIPLSSFDVYERPRNRWYALNSKPGKENTKERGELEVRIGFIVKAGSLTDLTRKERHKSSLGQLSTAAQSIGGSLLSIGSLEKRKGLKKLAKSIGNKVKGKSKNRLDVDNLDEKEEHQFTRITRQEPGEADPGVISEDEDEFTFDDLSHKSSASSLNVPTPGVNGSNTNGVGIPHGSQNNVSNEVHHTPPVPVNAAPSKPPRFAMSASTTNLSKVGNTKDDEWGLKLYGKQASSVPKRWEHKPSPKIVVDEPQDNKRDASPARSSSPALRLKEPPEPPSPAPREILQPKNKDEKFASSKEKLLKEDKSRDKKDDKLGTRSPKEEKYAKKDKKRDKENKYNDENHLSSERIIIGGEDAVKNAANSRSRLPHEVLNQFEGKSREDLIELALQLQAQVTEKNKRLTDLEDYIDALLLRVIECSPRLLQNPYMSQRRLSSPGHQ